VTRVLKLKIQGRVQGVGFRYWMKSQADALNICGWVRNCHDGSVEALVSGNNVDMDHLIARCHLGPRWASVAAVETEMCDEELTATGFEIITNR